VGDLLGIAAGDDLLGGIVLEALRLVNRDCIGQLKGDDRKPKEWSLEIPSSVFDLVPAGKADHRGVLAKIERREKPGGNVLPEYALLPSLPRI